MSALEPLDEPTDELSASTFERHEAAEAEQSIHGRPYELSAARRGLLVRFANDKLAFAALGWLILVGAVAILATWIAPYGQSEGTLGDADRSPVWNGGSWDHVFGTTPQGYDILSRLIHGARTSLLIGVAVVKPAEFVIFRIGQFTADRKS